MISEGMGIQSVGVKSAFRLGARREVGSRPRSLLVNLSGDREEVLKKAGLIRQYQGWESIFIDPDRTPNERQYYVALREELKARRGRGETDLIIKNGQIVHRRHAPIEIPLTLPNHTSTETTNTDTRQESTEGVDEREEVVAATATGNQDPPATQNNDQNTSQVQVSDDTLVDIEVPEIPRTNDEEEEDAQGYMTCTNN